MTEPVVPSHPGASFRPDGDLHPQAILMVGKRYGRLMVVSEEPRKDYRAGAGYRVRMVKVRCECGAVFVALASHVRNRIRSCLACGAARQTVTNRTRSSVRLTNGWTIAQVALAYGLPLDTVYARHRRGWPAEKLSLPVGQWRGGRKGIGSNERVRPAVTLRRAAP
jgi:hypothetical protein